MDSTGTVKDLLSHDALPLSTTKFAYTIPQTTEQILISFKLSDFFDPILDLMNIWPNLTNKNLFNQKKCQFSGKDGYYETIKSALQLTSRLILSYSTHYMPFITRSEYYDFVRDEVVPITPTDTLLSLIRIAILFIDMDEGMYEMREKWTMTALEPNEDKDVILFDFRLLRICKVTWVPIFQKYILCFILALLIYHEMAHILEFRIVRKKSLNLSRVVFLTLPGVTCREAGIA